MASKEKTMKATDKVTVLTHLQQIRTTMDEFEPVVTVGTIEGCARTYNENPKNALARNSTHQGKNHHQEYPLAWTHKGATCLTSNYPGKDEAMKVKHQSYLEAVLVTDGELVLIEGRAYRAKYLGMRYSDPVRFDPVE